MGAVSGALKLRVRGKMGQICFRRLDGLKAFNRQLLGTATRMLALVYGGTEA